MLKENAWSLKCGRVGTNLERDERVRPDVLARFYLRAAKEGTHIALHIGRRDVEYVHAELAACLARELICEHADGNRGELAGGKLSAPSDDIVTARKSRPFELQQRSR